jgi:hypothetical protein
MISLSADSKTLKFALRAYMSVLFSLSRLTLSGIGCLFIHYLCSTHSIQLNNNKRAG